MSKEIATQDSIKVFYDKMTQLIVQGRFRLRPERKSESDNVTYINPPTIQVKIGNTWINM